MKTSSHFLFCATKHCASVLALVATSAFAVVPQARITAPIENTQRTELSGTLSPHAHAVNDAGAVAPNTPLNSMGLVFSRTPAQQQALEALAAAQQNPASPQYHRFLTPEQFAAQFGVADADIARTEAWLQQQGFTVTGVSRSHDRITFSGNAGQVAAAFGTELHNYTTASGTRFAPSKPLSVPSALASSVLTITNLSSFQPRPHVKLVPSSLDHAHYTTGNNQNVFLGPKDLGTIYDVNAIYSAGFNGATQSIAIVGQSAIVPTDITNFQTGFGLAAKPPTQILMPGTGSSTPFQGDESESDIDLEYSSAMAPGATIYFVYTGSSQNFGVFDALEFAVDNAIAPIISISYGVCEPDLAVSDYNQLNSILLQAATQGQTILSAAGDDGSTDCWGDTSDSAAQREQLAADFPSSSQYVTGMGGTEVPTANISTAYFNLSTNGSDLISSAKSYIPEQVWNDDAAAVQNGDIGPNGTLVLNSGGGGTSIYTARPTWQAGVPGIASGTTRLVPDLALLASNFNAPYILCSSDTTSWNSGQAGSCTSGLRDAASSQFTLAGGTSFAAPIMAGLVAVLNQAKGYTGGQGLINPTLYSLASSPTTYALAFHDINVSGSGNECAAGTTFCSSAGVSQYFSAPGYDEASGLGSIDFANLVAAWPAPTTTPSAASFSLSATNVTVASGSSGTTTITVTPSNGFTGNVNLAASGPASLINTCFSLSSTSVTGTSAASATITIATGQASCGTGASPLVKGKQLVAATSQPSSQNRTTLATLAAGSIFAFLLFTRRRKTLLGLRGAALVVMMALAAVGAMGLTGCSNQSSGVAPPANNNNPTGPTATTPSGTYTITVNGIAGINGATTATTNFTLTVN